MSVQFLYDNPKGMYDNVASFWVLRSSIFSYTEITMDK